MKDIFKKKLIFIFILFICLSTFLICSKNSDNITLDEVRLKDNEINKKQFAMYIKDGNEEYQEYTGDDLFPKGYKLNKEKSFCIDNNGDEVDTTDVISQTSDGKIMVTSTKTVYCTFYFDKEPTASEKLTQNLIGGLKQTTNAGDLKYRYVGKNSDIINNYICFGTTTKDDCTSSNSNYLYRIIGIDEEGKLKIIKNSSIGNRQWHTSFQGSDAIVYWDGGSKSAKLYSDLNGSIFLDNKIYVPMGWDAKIAKVNWHIGDVQSYITNPYGDTIQEQEGSKSASTASKIGLMYLSDYYYSLDGSGSLDCSDYSDNKEQCKTNWLHISNNGVSDTASLNEWTITRYGPKNNGARYDAWLISQEGYISNPGLTVFAEVRPAFYLTADSIIKDGAGTSDNPYILEDPNKKGIELAKEKFNGEIPAGFTTTSVAGMYRFIGTNPNNYICFGTRGKCSSNSDYIYRIIGIEEETGRLKLIKNTAIDKNAIWNSGYTGSENNAIWDTGVGKKSAELYINLNDEKFLNNNTYVPDGWKIKIDDTNWYIGDVNGDSYAQSGGNEIYNQEMLTVAETSSKIGLMYLSDYYYSLDGEGKTNCRDGGSSVYSKCKTTWLHLSNNGDNSTTSYSEWTMTRYGLDGSNYNAWNVYYNGQINRYILNNINAIRPVFYLTESSKIAIGTGTINDPFVLDTSDIPLTESEQFIKDKLGNIPEKLLETTKGDLKYRFVGTQEEDIAGNINNYICFGANDCSNNPNHNHLYRIIGITEKGNLKIQKNKALDSDFIWTGTGTDWANSGIYSSLIGNNFYSNSDYVTESMKNKIEKEYKWNIGDVTSYTNGNTVYNTENNDSKHIGAVGLAYLSDYYYAYNEEGTQNCYNNSPYCKSWMIPSSYRILWSNKDYEWTMTRYSNSSAWDMSYLGRAGCPGIQSSLAVRPVFYLINDIKISSGTGTLENPFILSGN